MNICDLKHLEAVNEAPEVIGGGGVFGFVGYQSNDALVDQYALSAADAEAFDGSATATAISTNDSALLQTNNALIV